MNHPPQVDTFTRFRFLSQPKYAPGGGALAFVATRVAEQNARRGYVPELWLYTGGEPRRLAGLGPGMVYTWVGGSALLFAASREAKDAERKEKGERFTRFYRLPIDGGEAVPAFEVPYPVDAAEHLGGKRYLLLAEVEYGEPKPAHGADEAVCEVLDELPFWYNGRGFVNKKRQELFLYEAGGTSAPLSEGLGDVTQYALAPGYERVVFALRTSNGVQAAKDELWEYRFGDEAPRRLLEARFSIDGLACHGQGVVFAGAGGAAYGMVENPKIYLLEQGGELHELADPDAAIGEAVATDCRYGGGGTFKVWEDTLYFTMLRGFCSGLYKMALPGGAPEPLCGIPGSVDCFDVADGALALVGFAGQDLQELYTLEKDGARRLTGFNTEAVTGLWRGVPYHHSFTRAGFGIDGWAIPPAGYDPAKKYPAILDIHGGPKTAYGEIYFHEMQLWAARGYFVLYCNPRGSDGKGNAFADIRGHYGEGDYEDIMAFVDEMLRLWPAINPARLGVTGGSYGGFMTNWIIGHTGRFAAAAAQRSISNWLSFAGVSDIGYSFTADQIGAQPWEDAEALWRQSPLKYAGEAATPTLFIHSDEDYRCWLPESLQMFSALRLRGVESRVCLFHGENHELSRSGSPAARVRRLEEITAWMDRWLQNGKTGPEDDPIQK